GAGGYAGRRVRCGRGAHRAVRALLVVHGRHRYVPRGRGRGSVDRPGRQGGEGLRVARRDRRPRGDRKASRRCLVRGASLRGSRVRALPAREARPVKARLSTDGGARGNPGPAAYGYVLEAEDGTVLAAHGEKIGVATNNVAEYRALIAGLEKAVELAIPEVEVVSDSELLVKQMTGEYRVKNEALRELPPQAARLARQVGTVTYRAVRREDKWPAALLG